VFNPKVDNVTGVAEMGNTDYWDFSQPYGDLLLETVTFNLVGMGAANLSMDFWIPEGDGHFTTWPWPPGSAVDDLIEFQGATVTVNPATDSPAPLPGVLLLLLLD
jgi:hypothetical protein